MFVLIRADSSSKIGAGHIMRCLTLALELRRRGVDVEFVSRVLKGNILNHVREHGFSVGAIPSLNPNGDESIDYEYDAKETIEVINKRCVDWCIVDNYNLDSKWHKLVKQKIDNVFVIDDMPNRQFDCEVLLDQTYARNECDYTNLTPNDCKLLLGTEYALLRSEFSELRSYALKKSNNFTGEWKIMISMGGMDIDNYTSVVLRAIEKFSWTIRPQITIALNSSSPHLDDISKLIKDMMIEARLYIDTDDMAKMMLEADFAIGGGGTTSWERCCLGLPTIAIILADNQRQIVDNLEQAGAVIKVDAMNTDLDRSLNNAFSEITNNEDRLISLSRNAINICDGSGLTKCADIICSRS